MKKFMFNLFNNLKQVLFPKNITCNFCKRELNIYSRYELCSECFDKLKFNTQKICTKCGRHVENNTDLCQSCFNTEHSFKVARSALVYDGIIIPNIHKFKYNNARYLSRTFNKFLIEKYIELDWSVDMIIPVPLYKKRLKERGYNQSELLCKDFETELNIPVRNDILIKRLNTLSQTNLDLHERVKNLEEAFVCINEQDLKAKTVLLIDDVMTTASTLDECAKTLKRFGAKRVYALTLSSVEQKDNIRQQDE